MRISEAAAPGGFILRLDGATDPPMCSHGKGLARHGCATHFLRALVGGCQIDDMLTTSSRSRSTSWVRLDNCLSSLSPRQHIDCCTFESISLRPGIDYRR